MERRWTGSEGCEAGRHAVGTIYQTVFEIHPFHVPGEEGMDIGIFGGSFNPPHAAHLIVAETVRDQFGLEAVWWIPSARPPHKPAGELASAAHRLRMTELATASNPAFRVLDAEIRRRGPSYTLDTLRALQEKHPGTAFALIIGSDSLRSFGTWHRPEAIIERVPLIVYKRPGATVSVVAPRFANHVRFADAPLMEVSGTEIRARRRTGRSIRYLVPEAVRTYIDEHALYAGGPPAAETVPADRASADKTT